MFVQSRGKNVSGIEEVSYTHFLGSVDTDTSRPASLFIKVFVNGIALKAKVDSRADFIAMGDHFLDISNKLIPTKPLKVPSDVPLDVAGKFRAKLR